MTTVNFTNPRARFFNRNGDPLAEGRVYFYVVGTNTLKKVYTTALGDIQAANPQPLDIEGFVVNDTGIHLGEGLYDIKVEEKTGESTWAQYWTYPDIQGSSISGGTTAFSNINVGTIQNLRDLQGGSYGMAFVMGYYAINDGGGRQMYWNATSTKAENGGTVIVPQGNPAIGRWEWIPTNGDTSITPQLFGGLPSDGSLVVASQIASMINWCDSSNYKNIHFNLSGVYHTNSSQIFSNDLNVIIDAGVSFESNSGFASITFDCQSLDIKGTSALVDPLATENTMDMTISVKEAMDVYPTWWNADPEDSNLASLAFIGMLSGLGTNHRIVIDGNFITSGTAFDFSNNAVLFKSGATIYNANGSYNYGYVTSESKTPVMTGNINGITFTGLSCDASLLEWSVGGLVSDDINAFIEDNTNLGANSFRFIVGEGDYQFDHSCDGELVDRPSLLKFIWDLREGCNISTSSQGFVDFGVVVAGDYKIFDELSIQYSMRFFQDQKIQWFGAVSNNTDKSTVNANAFVTAISMNSQSNKDNNWYDVAYTKLDLGGSTFFCDAIYVDDYTSDRAEAYMDNGKIRSVNLINGEYALNIAYGLLCDRVDIKVNQDSYKAVNCRRNKFQFTDGFMSAKNTLITSVGSDDFTVKNSELLITESDTTSIDLIVNSGGLFTFTNNKAGRSQITNTGACIVANTSGQSTCDNNVFDGVTPSMLGSGSVSHNKSTLGSIHLSNPLNMYCVGNQLTTDDDYDARIYFTTNTNGFVIVGLVCENNTFVDGVSDPSTRTKYSAIAKDGSFFASSGHKLSIKNNYVNPLYLQAMATTIDSIVALGVLISGTSYLLETSFVESEPLNTYFFDLVDNTNNPNEFSHAFLDGGTTFGFTHFNFQPLETSPLGSFRLVFTPVGANYLGSLTIHIVASTISPAFYMQGTLTGA